MAVVCSSNMNRSMEAHGFISKKHFNVDSYGTGDKVKLPGPSADRPNVYDFGTSYEEIHADLKKKDKTMYTQNGILNMLDRNRRIKLAPQRLQESKEKYDVIFTAEERVYDQVIEHFENTGNVRLVSFFFLIYRMFGDFEKGLRASTMLKHVKKVLNFDSLSKMTHFLLHYNSKTPSCTSFFDL